MQWIREQKQSVALESLGGEHRRRPTAHRASADDESPGTQLLASALNDRREALLELRHRVGPSGFPFLVKEVEADDANPTSAKRVRGIEQPTIIHVPARSVRADEHHP